MKKGKEFEQKSFSIIKDHFKGKTVFPEKRIKTTYNGFRKIDISVGTPGDHDFIIFECKDEEKIGIDALDQVFSQGKAVDAKKIAIVGNGQFTKDLIEASKTELYSCSLYNIIDPADDKLRPKILVPVLHHFFWLEKFTYECKFGDQPLRLFSSPENVKLSQDGNILLVAKRLWNSNMLTRKRGSHVFTYDKFNMAESLDDGVKSVPVDSITFTYSVTEKTFLSPTEIVKGQGLFNVHEQVFETISEEITLGPMSIEKIGVAENEVKNGYSNIKSAFEGFYYHILD